MRKIFAFELKPTEIIANVGQVKEVAPVNDFIKVAVAPLSFPFMDVMNVKGELITSKCPTDTLVFFYDRNRTIYIL